MSLVCVEQRTVLPGQRMWIKDESKAHSKLPPRPLSPCNTWSLGTSCGLSRQPKKALLPSAPQRHIMARSTTNLPQPKTVPPLSFSLSLSEIPKTQRFN